MRAVPPLPDSRPVKRLACVSAIVAAAAGSIHAFVPSALAPRINVRWVPSLPSTERENAERALGLREGERMDGSTWSYDLTSPSQATIETLITHPLVEDTHHLDRTSRRVSADAPAGRTRIRGGLSLAHDSKLLGWVERSACSVLFVALAWLVTNRPRDGRGSDSA